MVGGQAHMVKDVPPYMLVDGKSTEITGLNRVGLARNGVSADDVKLLKDIYKILYRRGLSWKEILRLLSEEYDFGAGADVVRFLNTTKRGILRARRMRGGPESGSNSESAENGEQDGTADC